MQVSDATILGQLGRTGHTTKFHFLILLLINSKKKKMLKMRNQKRAEGEGACNGEGQEEREHSNNLGLMQRRGDSAVLG